MRAPRPKPREMKESRPARRRPRTACAMRPPSVKSQQYLQGRAENHKVQTVNKDFPRKIKHNYQIQTAKQVEAYREVQQMREGRSEHLLREQPGEVHRQAHRYMVRSRIVRMTEEDCCRRIEGGYLYLWGKNNLNIKLSASCARYTTYSNPRMRMYMIDKAAQQGSQVLAQQCLTCSYLRNSHSMVLGIQVDSKLETKT